MFAEYELGATKVGAKAKDAAYQAAVYINPGDSTSCQVRFCVPFSLERLHGLQMLQTVIITRSPQAWLGHSFGKHHGSAGILSRNLEHVMSV